MPTGLDETVPVPVPARLTVSGYVKRAVTDLAAFNVSTHAPVPEQPPLQPANVAPAAGLAVSVTSVPETYASLQSEPQSMPAGLELTVPPPAPTLTLKVCVTAVNVAVTDLAASIVKRHWPE